MNKSSSKKVVADKSFAAYLLPTELTRFTTDILTLAQYMVPWAEKNGGSAVITELQKVVTAMDAAAAALQTVLTPPTKPSKKVA